MASILNVLALGLAMSLPLASQATTVFPVAPNEVSDTDFPQVGSLHGQAREVPEGVTTFKGVVPQMTEGRHKAYAFTLAPRERIQVKVIESSPRKVHLTGATPENILLSKKWTDLSKVSFLNTMEKPRLFYVLVRGGYDGDECQFVLGIDRKKAAGGPK
jgi:hypothetical protein